MVHMGAIMGHDGVYLRLLRSSLRFWSFLVRQIVPSNAARSVRSTEMLSNFLILFVVIPVRVVLQQVAVLPEC